MGVKRSRSATFLLMFSLSICSHSAAQQPATPCTLQVGAFLDRESAEQFASRLQEVGEAVFIAEVELAERGTWVRVFVGAFQTLTQARSYGHKLVARKLIQDFLVKPHQALRKATAWPANQKTGHGRGGSEPQVVDAQARDLTEVASTAPMTQPQPVLLTRATSPTLLPLSKPVDMSTLPQYLSSHLTGNHPFLLAVRLLGIGQGFDHHPVRKHPGLWLSGNTLEGMVRLRWILGAYSQLISLDPTGKIVLDVVALMQQAGGEAGSTDAPFRLACYIAANEGLLLIVQLTQAGRRYGLHIGNQAPTLNGTVTVNGAINLDPNYDSRINPYRRAGIKLDKERPPEGFDSLVAINPIACWFNLQTKKFVPAGQITFHELAEAQAKLAYGLQYLPQKQSPGAHNVAMERESRLQIQRPQFGVVTTAGMNRVLTSESEIKLFHADSKQSLTER